MSALALLRRSLQAALVFAYLIAAVSAKPAPIPSIEGHLTAPGNQLTSEQKHELDLRLGKVQEQAKFDLAIYILPDKTSASLTNWGTDIFRTWGVGRDWPQGGALIVVSADGTECTMILSEPRAIPEKLAESVQNNIIKRAKAGHFYDALTEAAERCRRFVGRKSLPILQEPLEPDSASARSYLTAAALVALVACASNWIGWAR